MNAEVVQLHHPSVQGRYRPLVSECRVLVIVHLTAQLNTLFEKVEPTFINFANKAETNTAQARLFDALNLIRDQRDQIEHIFREVIADGFEAFHHGKPISYPTSRIEGASSDDLEVVENEDLEKHLAVENMVNKANADHYQQLYALGQRLAVLRGGKKLVEEDIPGCPAHIASAFQMATENLILEKEELLILYLLFGKFVMGETSHTFSSFNDKLIEAGILPNLKLNASKPPVYHGPKQGSSPTFDQFQEAAPSPSQGAQTAEGSPSHPGTGTAATINLEEEIFQSIRSLMAMQRSADPNYTPPAPGQVDSAGGYPQGSSSLVTAIGGIQSQADIGFISGDIDEQGLLPDIQLDTDLIKRARETLVSERAKLYEAIDQQQIPTADLDTIELVGMLFEEVLNEDQLSNITKALISYLHTPYLKAAIIDHHFLTDSDHISRKLLNLMVDAGKVWVDEEDLRRGLYYPMQDSVHVILTSFVDDFEIFDEQYEILANLIMQLENRARIVEERNREAARGKEKLEGARERAHCIIDARSQGESLHLVVEHFLYHAWMDRMILILLRDPEAEQSNEWADVLEVTDQILHAGRASTDGESRNWLQQNLPQLKARIEEGVDSLGEYHSPDVKSLFKLFDSYIQPDTPIPEQVAPAKTKTTHPGNQHQEKPAKAVKPTFTPEEQKIIDQLHEIEFGTWFQFKDTSGHLRRLKLSWFSTITNKYMFVDRFGIQAEVIPLVDLVKQIVRNKAVIIEEPDRPFVERAMRAINNLLKKVLSD